MTQINKYTSRETYSADAERSAEKSAVSYIAQNRALIYDGVNVVVGGASAEVGDLAVYDKTDNSTKFIKGATLVKDQMPASLTPLAVVYAVRGDQIHVVSLDNATYNGSAVIRWAAPYEVALSGFDLAVGGTFVLTLGSGSAAAEVSVTYPAGATLTDVASAINATLKGGTPDYSLVSYGGWTASIDEANSRIILSSNTSSPAYATIEVVSGCEITRTPENKNYQTTLTGVLIEGTTEYVRRKNGVSTSWAGCNAEKFLQYYSVNGSEKTGQKPGSSEVIRESVFTEADNPELVAAYPTYKDYLLSEHMLEYPSAYGAVLRDGKENTAKIGGLRFVNIHGETVACYPPAAAALEYGVVVEGATTGLEAGAWWLPSIDEIVLLMRDRVLASADRESDPVNLTLARLGKSTCYGSGFYPWTSCECNSSYAFIYYGYAGIVYNNGKYGTYSVRPVSIISIND